MKRIGPVVVLLLFSLVLPTGTAADMTIDGATNDVRTSHGLPALVTDSAATALAERRVREIATSFAHPSDWGLLFQYLPSCVTGAGENIAYRTTWDTTTGAQFVASWSASPPHLANILGTWDGMGSAMFAASDGRTYAVQIFVIGCRTPKPPADPTPPPPAPPRTPASAAPQPALLVLPNTATSTECLKNCQPHNPKTTYSRSSTMTRLSASMPE